MSTVEQMAGAMMTFCISQLARGRLPSHLDAIDYPTWTMCPPLVRQQRRNRHRGENSPGGAAQDELAHP
jgi:hypothetical protein